MFRATTSTRHDMSLVFLKKQQFNQIFLWTIEWPLFDISHLPSATDNKSLESPTFRSTNSFLNRTLPFENNDLISHLKPTSDVVQPAAPLPKASSTTRSSTAASSSSTTPAAPYLVFNHLLASHCPSNFLELIFVLQH